ncbi:MAG: hypothetical protein EXR76_18570 [Myxococcales bacterium]|nr:hypothetical protein [Myxococcales bacterium]
MFESTLARVVEQTSAHGAALMSLEGLSIDAVGADGRPVHPDEVAREYASVFQQIVNGADALDIGRVTELCVEGETESTLVRLLTPQYFVALRLPNEQPQGKGRFYLRVAAPDLLREL